MDSHSVQRYWRKFKHITHYDQLSPATRRIMVLVVGGVILLAGLAMLVLPGPAIVMIPLGLAILATEFAWARLLLRKTKRLLHRAKAKASS